MDPLMRYLYRIFFSKSKHAGHILYYLDPKERTEVKQFLKQYKVKESLV